MKRHMIRILVLFLPLLAVACNEGHEQPKAGRSRRGAIEERLPRVEVVEPVRKRLIRRLDVSATVEALKRVDLAARVPGEVKFLDDKMEIGRTVKEGETLLKLYVPDVEAERASKLALKEQASKQLQVAEKALVVAKREVDETRADEKRFSADVKFNAQRLSRIRDLVRKGAQDQALEQESTKQYESAQAALESNRVKGTKNEARVESAQAEIALARQRIQSAEAEVRKVEAMLEFATIKAPFDGVITRRWVDPGAILREAGARLFTIQQMTRVRVLIDVPQRDVPNLNSREQNPNPDGKGDLVLIKMPALTEVYPMGEIQGWVTRISRSLDPVTRTMRAEVELDNPDRHLRPGMFGSASVVVEDRSNVLTVPASALVRRGENMVEVLVIASPTGEGDQRRGVLKRVPVTLGIDDGKEVEIRTGIKDDDLIVARATGVMRDGESVLAISAREQ